ncbi:SLC13 family permease [Thermococcus sp.]|uniref:SLC13 family permease n=1 Tax=Thermococcus sp. TaxID=35749 RepID=UPI00345C5153
MTLLMVLYVALAVIDNSLPKRTPWLIDWGSLSLIMALIITSKGLELSGIFGKLAPKLVEKANHSGKRLLFLLLPTIAFSSAVIMNDTAMLVFIPLVVALSELSGLDKAKAVTLSAISANVGSALTPIGNPQNIIIWHRYKLGFTTFTLGMLPFVLLWLGILMTFVLISREERLILESIPGVAFRRDLFLLSLLTLITDVYLGETGKHYLALLITLVVFLLFEREVLLSFDWALVLTFAFIFADFNELSILLQSSGLSFPREGSLLILTSAGVSQLISNVPATVVFLNSNPQWLPLAVGVNAGGNGVIVGSLANLIALRIARILVRDFHRYSVPYFLLSLAVAIVAFDF